MAPPSVYAGPFGPAQAEHLLTLLLTSGPERLVGKPPKVNGMRIFPFDRFGHDHLWWLDRMVRTSRRLVERMTLVWHDRARGMRATLVVR